MTCGGRGAWPLLLAALCAPAFGKASLLDEAALLQALQQQAPCCVIDGRKAEHRQALPLAQALPYRDGMKIHPTAGVVVLADSDEQALAIARRFDKAYPGKTIMAVKGGHAVWQAVLQKEQSSQSQGLHGSRSFVIPSNTCEQGKPLQTLPRSFK